MEVFLVDHLARVFDLLRSELKGDAVSHVHDTVLENLHLVLVYGRLRTCSCSIVVSQ